MSQTEWTLKDEKPMYGSLLKRNQLRKPERSSEGTSSSRRAESSTLNRLTGESTSTLGRRGLKDDFSGNYKDDLRSSNLNTLLLADRFQYKLKQRKNMLRDANAKFYISLYHRLQPLRVVMIFVSILLIFITKPAWCERNERMSVCLDNFRKTVLLI